MLGFSSKGSWLVPGRISNLLSCSADIRFRAAKAPLAKISPRRKTWGLSTREGLKIISGTRKVLLVSTLIYLLL